MTDRPPPDARERERIVRDLDTNLLVEAGAGAGKTTMMVDRMVALVRTGRATVDRIAAVTFTRKAAAELRERFQEVLERAYRESRRAGSQKNAAESDESVRIDRALREIDRCFIGTIHSFCAKLLRERPLEAGVPPGFRELSGAEQDRFRDECWARFIERLASHQKPGWTQPRESRFLERLDRVGLDPRQLEGLFRTIAGNPDVRYAAAPVAAPGRDAVRRVQCALESLLNRSFNLRTDRQPADGWDDLQNKVGRLQFSRSIPGWDEDADFFDVLTDAIEASNRIVQKRWGADGETKKAAKALAAEWDDFARDDGPARALLNSWLAHRYPLALRFARTAARYYAEERRRAGRLDFQDLLTGAARLLRGHPAARRALGERYRYLLVDEFQDTDPIQAEVLLLLSTDESGAGISCWDARPRPGAFFVVGDPKQSIYRFRRADISVYNRVKRQFMIWREERGPTYADQVKLTANFRSVHPIGDFVNAVFEAAFPEEATEEQAAFAPLRTRGESDRVPTGVFWYEFEAARGRGGFVGRRITEPEAPRLASWIRRRVAAGERSPSDFLILCRQGNNLDAYASELERYGVPVDLTGGAAVSTAEAELMELLLLLRALGDPGNPVLCLAVLEGLFFGLDHQVLFDFVRNGGSLDFMDAMDRGSGPVASALQELHDYHELTRREPADVAVPWIVERLGLIPYVAAGELGATRTGAVLSALDAVRASALDGHASLRHAIEAVQQLVDGDGAATAPLAPEPDAVRIMTLHQAKGLEAPVVILAYPAKCRDYPPTQHIERSGGETARGHLVAGDSRSRGSRTIARPADWDRLAEAERAFESAEAVRLLYVAATRAEEELVIGRCDRTGEASFWGPLHSALDDSSLSTELELPLDEPPARERLEIEPSDIEVEISAAEAERKAASAPGYRAAGAGERLGRGDVVERDRHPRPDASAAPSGREWGRLVHGVLEASADIDIGDNDALHAICRHVLLTLNDPNDAEGNEAHLLDELAASVRTVHGSPLWRRARAAARLLVEVPFAISFTAQEYAKLAEAMDITADAPRPESNPEHAASTVSDAAPTPQPGTELVEGRIDLAFRENGGWTIVDYKSDRNGPEIPADRMEHYERQVKLYAACWERLTRETVAERALLFTATGDEVTLD